MPGVAEWLQELGLDRYAQAFEENEIDFETLPLLTETMLREIGIPIGPRARLLAAIVRLPAFSASAIEYQREDHAKREVAVQKRTSERRQITVLFCDVVDSTRLASSLDPEDLKSVMEAYRSACGAAIARYAGHVAQYRGDSIEAYFGWPEAQEDTAERAVRAGLGCVEAAKSIESAQTLSVRVGISTGVVVITDQDHGGVPIGVFGDAPYVAARLQLIAPANSVVISEATSRLVSGRFARQALGPQNLKGISEPIPAFRIRYVREDASRFRGARATVLTPLVDRRAELAWLQQQWRDTKDGEGRVVFVSGIPGIGKSRLVHELDQWIKDEPHVSLKFQCLPHNTQSPLSPVIEQLRRLGGLSAEDSDHTKLDKIRRVFSWAAEQAEKAMPLLAEMMSIAIEPLSGSAELAPPMQTKFQTLSMLVDLLLALSARNPVFCLLEDGQWADASTQELLDLLMGRIGNSRILLIVTHRPEYNPRADSYGNVSALQLSRLARRDVIRMAQLALRELPSVFLQRIIDESDSIPLFIEELARGVIESSRSDVLSVHNQSAERLASWSVPTSLRDSLAARLDRAPRARNVAQIAAVLGREFSRDILLHVSSISDAELNLALAHLQQSEVVQQIDSTPSARYAFKHALMRDAAYESLLKSSRREIHAKVAATIEEMSPEVVADQPELLAYHYSLAGNAELAVRYWLIGGHRAHGRSANLEAIAQFERALESLESLPKTPARDEIELDIQLTLGLCLVAVRGYSADDTRKSFERAYALSADSGGPLREFQAIFGMWGHYWMVARHDRSIELGETLLSKAEPLHQPITLAVGHRALGSTLFTLGDFSGAREHLEKAISLVPPASTERRSLSYAVDPRIASLLILGWDLWTLGFPDQALENVLLALEEARDSADPYSVAFAHYVMSAVRLLRGEYEHSLWHADSSLSVSLEHRINLYKLYSRFGRGCALAMMEQPENGLLEIREGIEEAHRCNLAYMQGFMLGWLATVQAETGDPGAALLTIDEALKSINDVAGRACESELLRLRGVCLLATFPGAAEEVEQIYLDAIAVAQAQRARSLELRATTSLARLLNDQGKSDQARLLLAPAYHWFTEGLETVDLRDAKTLFDELGSN